MLLRFLKRNFFPKRSPEPSGEKTLLVVCATRLRESDFWQNSPTGQCLAQLGRTSQRHLRWNIAYENTIGLSAIYNASLRRAGDADIVLFVHDDIWFHPGLLEAVEEGLQTFDVVGAIGNTRCTSDQPSWVHRGMAIESSNDELTTMRLVKDAPEYLSGFVGHGNPTSFTPEDCGNPRAACELLDGLLLAVNVAALRSADVEFDESFEFHFYDQDFCRSARSRGLRLGTWPLQVLHESQGAYGSPQWVSSYHKYLDKWSQGWSGYPMIEN